MMKFFFSVLKIKCCNTSKKKNIAIFMVLQHLALYPLVILHALLSSADFFQNQLFRKILLGIPSECQANWIQISPDILSGLIWVQTICKG